MIERKNGTQSNAITFLRASLKYFKFKKNSLIYGTVEFLKASLKYFK
jgi:hypothetical protein